MLEGIGVVADVMVVIIGISKEIPTCGEDIACTHVGWGEVYLRRAGDFKHLFGIVCHVAWQFIAQVGINFFTVALHLYRVIYANAAVIGGDDNPILTAGKCFQQVAQRWMAKPGKGDTTVGCLGRAKSRIESTSVCRRMGEWTFQWNGCQWWISPGIC